MGGATVIETGRSSDGKQWYRLWSDGWLEQGGTASVSSGVYIPVTFLKQYADVSYTVVVTPADGSPADNLLVNSTWQDKTVSGFKIYCSYVVRGIAYPDALNCWYACGPS